MLVFFFFVLNDGFCFVYGLLFLVVVKVCFFDFNLDNFCVFWLLRLVCVIFSIFWEFLFFMELVYLDCEFIICIVLGIVCDVSLVVFFFCFNFDLCLISILLRLMVWLLVFLGEVDWVVLVFLIVLLSILSFFVLVVLIFFFRWDLCLIKDFFRFGFCVNEIFFFFCGENLLRLFFCFFWVVVFFFLRCDIFFINILFSFFFLIWILGL